MKNNPNANLNSPENVLGDWLIGMSDEIQSLAFVIDDYEKTRSALLAIVLDFSNKNKKLMEMYFWLKSDDGKEFLYRDEYQPAGGMVAGELDVINDDLMLSNQEMSDYLFEYIEDNLVNYRHQPQLR